MFLENHLKNDYLKIYLIINIKDIKIKYVFRDEFKK